MTQYFCFLFRLLLLPAAFFYVSALGAQSFKKTFKQYSREPATYVETFERFKNHAKYAPAARYFLAKNRLRSERSFSGLSVLNNELLQADSMYQKLSPRRARKLNRKYGVDTMRLHELRMDVQRWALAGVRSSGTVFALDSMLDFWQRPFPELQPELDSTRTQIVHTQLNSEDYDVMTDIVHRHLAYVQPQYYKYSRQMYDRLWTAFQEKYSLCELERYAADHPNTFVARDCWRKEARMLFCESTLPQLLDFEVNNKWTAFEPMLLNVIMNKATAENTIGLSPERFALLQDLQERAALRERMRSGQAIRDTTATLNQTLQYISTYAPRYSAYRLLEEALQFFVAAELYGSSVQLFERARPYFPDTLPAYCNSNYDYQKRVRPYIDGLLPVLKKKEPEVKETFIAAVNREERDEFNPVLNNNQTALYFAASETGGNADDTDVWVSYRKDSLWSEPVQVFSGPDRQAPLSLTADGKTMLLLVNGKLHSSRQEKGKWKAPVPVVIGGLPYIAKAVLSADGRTMIIEGSYAEGGVLNAPDIDLFISHANSDGSWSDPAALGSDINTDGDEGNPFLSADGSNLYFTSTEFPGLGKTDVFVARRTGSDWVMDWGKPENLGKKINNIYAHQGFGYVSPDGKTMYFTRYSRDREKGNIWMLQVKD